MITIKLDKPFKYDEIEFKDKIELDPDSLTGAEIYDILRKAERRGAIELKDQKDQGELFALSYASTAFLSKLFHESLIATLMGVGSDFTKIMPGAVYMKLMNAVGKWVADVLGDGQDEKTEEDNNKAEAADQDATPDEADLEDPVPEPVLAAKN